MQKKVGDRDEFGRRNPPSFLITFLRGGETVDNEFKEYIKTMAKKYEEHNELKKEHDKRRKQIRDEIKAEMESEDIREYDDTEINVKVIENQRKDVDDEKLLEVIKDYNLDAIKDAPDIKKLENLVDEGEVPAEALPKISECINIREWSYITTKNKND